ncbi:hypothetical protein FRUB_00286 [Fimbriiglobus ruber]|uniref:Uncharacterized protein n=1 Tax=Fimbriiglobus ruber TaxID=1908690 RepID=A0A225EE50_9BACT|nr:hypothetical protein FRUB_00286 [Fimbriiglobus ruber]
MIRYSQADVTQLYAERDERLALEVAAKMGYDLDQVLTKEARNARSRGQRRI